ncbi:MAG: ABC transporter permease [Candidatus Aenigmarchaeota archaeon]|nr:ABC transporter permease [Candidatus Aenigmarchaeota archaeon]
MANVKGFWTLTYREVTRIRKIVHQTILAPAISALLYIIVFGVFIGAQIGNVAGVSYIEFLVPGLIMMTVITNAYMQTSSQILLSKIWGNLQELLTTPLSYFEMVLALTLGGVVRGFIVGIVTLLVALLFAQISIANIFAFVYFIFFVSLIFSSIGLIVGLWADKFDHLAALTNFFLTPLTFLGGVFYSIHMLPAPLAQASAFNPILYMINGMRFGVLGISDVNVVFSAAFVFLVAAFFFSLNVWLFRRGYRIRT